MSKTILICYVPVLHDGYRKFFSKYKNVTLYILGPEIIKEFTHLSKEIRELDPVLMQKAISSLKLVKSVKVLDKKTLEKIAKSDAKIVMPDEDVMIDLRDKYLAGNKVKLDTIFLRWDKHKSSDGKKVKATQSISRKKFDQGILAELKKEAERSSDWWRRIGAAIVKDREVILKTRNRHVPSDHSPYAEGDPRNNFHKGIGIELSTVLHSEAGLIAEAASKGINLTGADMYVTTFPCPPCAKQIAYSGIKRLFYAGGYSLLDQERILKSKGVKIIFVRPQ